MPSHVLFTQGLSNVYDAIVLARQAMRPGEFHFTAGYASPRTPIKTAADAFLIEPRIREEAAYVDWLLGVCRARDIDILWPQSRLPALLKHRQNFDDAGIELVLPCADADTLAILNDKTETAKKLREQDVPLPRWQQFQTPDELNDALARLQASCERICVKPAVSICAQGFRLLDDSRDAFTRFLHNDVYTIGLPELKTLLGANQQLFLAMEYLSGDERSIDCLVRGGTLIRSVTRRKPRTFRGRLEVVEDDPEGQAVAAKICQTFGLNGLVNLQTRERILPDGRREQCFLEINPRMSGGINMACESGLNLPYWTLRLAAGTAKPEDIPMPRTGLLVGTVYRALTLEDLSASGSGSAWPEEDEVGSLPVS